MLKITQRAVAALALVSLSVLAIPARAEVITVAFEATVNTVNESGAGLSIMVNDTVIGTFTYDPSAAIDVIPDPTFGEHQGALLGLEFAAGSETVSAGTGDTSNTIFIANISGEDSFTASHGDQSFNAVRNSAPVEQLFFSFRLTDTDGNL